MLLFVDVAVVALSFAVLAVAIVLAVVCCNCCCLLLLFLFLLVVCLLAVVGDDDNLITEVVAPPVVTDVVCNIDNIQFINSSTITLRNYKTRTRT